jgi:uncharacterized protein YjbI with pentapeptide repeats
LKANGFNWQVLDNLVGKFYGHTDIRGIDLSGSDLTDADLKEVDLFSANLKKTVFKFADLTGSYVSEANLKGACFDWERMKGVLVDNVDFDSKTSFIGINLKEINFTLAALIQESALGAGKNY